MEQRAGWQIVLGGVPAGDDLHPRTESKIGEGGTEGMGGKEGKNRG